MPLIYVFAASRREAQPALALAGKRSRQMRGPDSTVEQPGNRFTAIVTGIGTENAQIKAEATLGLAPSGAGGAQRIQRPDAILVIGLCGGLTGAMQEGRLVAYTQCYSPHQSLPVCCSPALTDAMIGFLEGHQIACDRVTGITSPRIASTKGEKLALAQSGASVVDMESYQIVSAAARAGLPSVVLRAVGDALDTKMPDFNPALDATGGLMVGKAIWIALASPRATFRLVKANNHAMKRLAPAVNLILQSNCFSNPKNSGRT